MTDPYNVLGISPNASEDEIKTAYRKLSQQYHPDRQSDSVMADIANEKMAEINAAYDKIMEMRRNGGGYSFQGYNNAYSIYNDVRIKIEHGNYTDADRILEQNRNDANAEWNYLKGTVCLSRGWMNDAYMYFDKAVRLDPSNREYAMAFSQIKNQRGGQMRNNPYTANRSNAGNADTCNTLCNICQCIMCADCLCDCI
ncbi:MAG: DnaJ domain-containing protein [Oscillospiraceae bacterium]|nr:DnaJ domain-containing protein [Oscillospiraceae bacterium]